MTHAKIYTWIDQSGTVNYSDQPHPGAEVVKMSSDSYTKDEPSQDTFKKKVPLLPPAQNIETLQAEPVLVEIVDPKNEETIRSNQGTVLIHIRTKPALKAEDNIQIFLDNLPVGSPSNANTFTLNGVLRGQHTISAKLLDAQGEVLSESKSVVIFMMPPRVNMIKRQ